MSTVIEHGAVVPKPAVNAVLHPDSAVEVFAVVVVVVVVVMMKAAAPCTSLSHVCVCSVDERGIEGVYARVFLTVSHTGHIHSCCASSASVYAWRKGMGNFVPRPVLATYTGY